MFTVPLQDITATEDTVLKDGGVGIAEAELITIAEAIAAIMDTTEIITTKGVTVSFAAIPTYFVHQI